MAGVLCYIYSYDRDAKNKQGSAWVNAERHKLSDHSKI
jgi:hypothetical protein